MKFKLLTFVLAALALIGIACNVKTTIALVLDGLAIACDDAAPLAGPGYGLWLIICADLAQMGAKELLTTDPAATQIAAIAAGANAAIAQAPNLDQASTTVKTVETALLAVATFCQVWQSQQGAAVAHAVAAQPIALTAKDKTALADIATRVAHVHQVLGK